MGAIKMSYKSHGGTCSGMGSAHMGGAPGSYISMGKGKPSGSADSKPKGSKGKRMGGNSSGKGSGRQPMGANTAAKKGMIGMGRD